MIRHGAVDTSARAPLPERPLWRIKGFKQEREQARRRVTYRNSTGGEAFAVTRYLVSGSALARDGALRSALFAATATFGGDVKLTGAKGFRRRADRDKGQ